MLNQIKNLSETKSVVAQDKTSRLLKRAYKLHKTILGCPLVFTQRKASF